QVRARLRKVVARLRRLLAHLRQTAAGPVREEHSGDDDHGETGDGGPECDIAVPGRQEVDLLAHGVLTSSRAAPRPVPPGNALARRDWPATSRFRCRTPRRDRAIRRVRAALPTGTGRS